MNIRIAPAVIAALVCSAHAAAGTYIEASRTDLLSPLRPPETQKMWFDGGSFRLENELGDAVEIFKDRTLYLVEPLRRRYTAFDATSLDQAPSEAREAHPAAAKAAALRPNEVSAANRGGEAAPGSRVARETSRTESSGGRTCTVWEIAVDGVKVQELCVIPAVSVPGGAQILADMRHVGELIDDLGLGETLRGSVAHSWGDLGLVNGIPILSRSFENGHATVEIQITAVRTEPVPFTAFEVPQGFKRHRLERRGRI